MLTSCNEMLKLEAVGVGDIVTATCITHKPAHSTTHHQICTALKQASSLQATVDTTK